MRGVGEGTPLLVEVDLHQVAPARLHPLGLEPKRREQVLGQAPVEKCPVGANRPDRQQRKLTGLGQRGTAGGLQLPGRILVEEHLQLLAGRGIGRLPPGEVRQAFAGLQPDAPLVDAGDPQGVQTTECGLFNVLHVPLLCVGLWAIVDRIGRHVYLMRHGMISTILRDGVQTVRTSRLS
jgi:hypothetical protein